MKLKKLICIAMISVLGVLSFAGCAKKQDAKKIETSSEARDVYKRQKQS